MFFRAIALQYIETPLSAMGSLRRGGRYNAKDDFEVLYLADRPDNSLREVGMLLDDKNRPIAVPAPPKIVFTIETRLQQAQPHQPHPQAPYAPPQPRPDDA